MGLYSPAVGIALEDMGHSALFDSMLTMLVVGM
jgi:hypothetical protein